MLATKTSCKKSVTAEKRSEESRELSERRRRWRDGEMEEVERWRRWRDKNKNKNIHFY